MFTKVILRRESFVWIRSALGERAQCVHNVCTVGLMSVCVCVVSPHLQEDLSELCTHFHQRVKVSTVWGDTQGIKVIGFEGFLFPAATEVTQTHR